MKKLVIAIVVLSLAAVPVWWIFFRGGERAPTSVESSPSSDAQSLEPRESGQRRRDPLPVSGTSVERAPFVLHVRGAGRAVPVHRVELSSRVGEAVTKVRVRAGDAVERGAVLVELDRRPFAIALSEAEAEVSNARIDFGARLLGEDGIDEEKRKRIADRTGLTTAEARVARAKLDLEGTRLRAPFAGRVSEIDVQVGERTSSGQPLVTLVSSDPIRIEAEVFESDFSRVQLEAEAEIRFPSLPDEVFVGTVSRLGPEIDSEQGTGTVYIDLPNPTERIHAGMYAEVKLEADRLPDRLAVPREALLERNKKLLVFRAMSGRAEWSYVEIGLETDDWVEIESGVAEGDTVLTKGHLTIAHGAPVKVAMESMVRPGSDETP